MARVTTFDQAGAALIIALIFLVMLTLLGLAAIGTNRAQQRETYGASEQVLAFQAAETGLIDGELWIEGQEVRPVPDCTESCSMSASILDGTVTPLTIRDALRRVTWWENNGRLYGRKYEIGKNPERIQEIIPRAPPGQTPAREEKDRLPRYVIEHLGKDPTASLVPGTPAYTLWYYRVTARGTGVQIDPPAIVQTVYAKGF